MDQKDIEAHALYRYADTVKEICHDLLTHTPVNYFCLGRAYLNGDYGGLLTDKGWAYYYLKNDFQQLGVEHLMASENVSHYFWNLTLLKPTCPKSQALYDGCIQFKHGSGIIFVTDYTDFREVSLITTDYNVYQNDPFLVENVSLLKRFILYFKEKLHENPELYAAFCKRYQNSITVEQSVQIEHSPKINFSIKKYYLGGSFQDVYFTKREADCLKYLYQGKTSKEIAKILNISFRTIETHLENIKQKSGCSSLQELMHKLKSTTLLDGI